MESNIEPLVLKVMRLRRPQAEAPRLPHPDASMGIDTPKLIIPMSLIQSLAGEPFVGYLHLSNRAAVPVTNVVLKVELQIGAVKSTLFSNDNDPIESIDPGNFFDIDVATELGEAGTYVLVCNVSYSLSGSSEVGIFKRSYRFPAMQPFAVSHRIVQMNSRLLVECIVENATQGSIHVTSWHLQCSQGYRSIPLDSCATNSGNHLLKPRGSHSLLFRVDIDPSAPGEGVDTRDDDSAIARTGELIGVLALGWHVPEGPSGCSQGYQLRMKSQAASHGEFDLRVVTGPAGQVQIEAPFDIEMEVRNQTDRTTEPFLILDPRLMGGIKVHGAIQRRCGRLEAGESTRLMLTLLATLPGMHSFQGASVIDNISEARCDFAPFIDVLAV